MSEAGWKDTWLPRVRAAVEMVRAAPTTIPAAAIDTFVATRGALTERYNELRGVTNGLDTVQRQLDKLEATLLLCIQAGVKPESSSPYQLQLASEPKRQQWNTEAVTQLLRHLEHELLNSVGDVGTHPRVIDDGTRLRLFRLFNPVVATELAATQGWIGGDKKTLQVMNVPPAKPEAFKGLF